MSFAARSSRRRGGIVPRPRSPRSQLSLLLSLLLSALYLVGASPARSQTQGFWHVFLYGNKVRDVVAQGDAVYAATSGGIVRLDPDGSFRQWNRAPQGLVSDSVSCATADFGGSLWFGTEKAGISVLDPSSDRIRTITQLQESLPGDAIRRIRFYGSADAETMLVAGGSGYSVFINGALRQPSCYQGIELCDIPSYDVRDVIKVGDSLWLATGNGIAVEYPTRLESGAVVRHWRSHSDGLPSGEMDFLARSDSLYAARDSSIWTWRGTAWGAAMEGLPAHFAPACLYVHDSRIWTAGSRGVYVRQGGSWHAVGSPSFPATSLTMTSSGRLVAGAATSSPQFDLGSPPDGIWVLNGSTWMQHRVDGPSLRSFDWDAHFDADGKLWLGIYTPGARPLVSRFSDGRWTLFNGGEGGHLNSTTWRIVEIPGHSGEYWLANGGCYTEDKMYLCHLERLRFPGGQPEFTRYAPRNPYDLDADATGRLWISSYNSQAGLSYGVYWYSAGSSTPDSLTQGMAGSRLLSDAVTAIRVAGRYVWIGYESHGVSRWDLGPDMIPDPNTDHWTDFSAAYSKPSLLFLRE